MASTPDSTSLALRVATAAVGRFVAPSVDAPALERLRAGASRLHGLTFERVIRGLTRRAYQQAVDGVNPYTRLVYAGGFERFVAEHSVSDYERKGLPGMFEALQNYRRDARDVPPILTFWLRKAAPGRTAELRIDVGEALIPGYVSTLPAGPGRWLLPVLDVPFLDFADRARHGALCALQWAILGELRERAEDYAAHGALDVDVAALASTIDGLSGALGDHARRAWIEGPAPWLRADARGRVALVDPGADRLLKEAARYTENARKGGQALAAIRRGEPPKKRRK